MAHVAHALAVWDITCKSDGNAEAVKSVLREIAKKWVFQEEEQRLDAVAAAAEASATAETKGEGTTPFRHWQIRLSLVAKLRLTSLKKVLDETCLKGAHLSPTTRGAKDGFSYVMKTATRIAGPWRDGAEEEKAEEPPQIVGKSLRPWQAQIKANLQAPTTDAERRAVNVLYDPVGGIGKSIFRTMCLWNKWAAVPPYMTEMKDTMAYALANPAKAYLIDVPRDALMKKLKEFWASIESLKDGRCYDTRYAFKERVMDNPKLWILTNSLPNRGWMSNDRWVIWMVHPTTDQLLDVTEAEDTVIVKLTELWTEKRNKAADERPTKRAKTLADFGIEV